MVATSQTSAGLKCTRLAHKTTDTPLTKLHLIFLKTEILSACLKYWILNIYHLIKLSNQHLICIFYNGLSPCFQGCIVQHLSLQCDRNSDLQAGIWFGSVALSPIITLPQSPMGQLFLPKKLPFLNMCGHAQCRVHFFHHGEFYFRLRQLITFPVLGQFHCACQAEKSSTNFFR